MKKNIYAYIRLVVMALTTVAVLGSCDKDTLLAYDLEGVWQGTITGNYYYDRYHVTANDYDTEIMFKQTSWDKGGTGYEIDRRFGSRTYTKTYFDWTVRNGKIYIDYDDGYRVVVRDFETYSMNGLMRFRGYFDNYLTGEQMASFSLVKVVEPNNYYDNHLGGYYSRQDAAPADSTSASH